MAADSSGADTSKATPLDPQPKEVLASLAISEGANVKVVQKLLGHKSAVLTLDRYGHLFPDDLDAVADAFDTAADALRTVGVFKPVVVGTNSP